MRANTITLKELNELFYIDSEYVLRWKVKRKGTNGIGSIVGHLTSNGYRSMKTKGKSYSVHRIIYQMIHSIEELDPNLEVDHIDCNKLNNNPDNLRLIHGKLNSRNRPNEYKSFTGIKGATYVYRKGRKSYWKAKIMIDGKVIHLGYHLTKEQAIEAYKQGSIKYHGEYGKHL